MTRLDDVFPRRRNETALTRGRGVRSRQPATDLPGRGGLGPGRAAGGARGDRVREREVGVRIRAGDPILDAEGLARAAEPEAARAVVPPRDDARRCEGAGLVALVGVHARRVEVRELARQGELAREPVAEERRASTWRGARTGGGEEGPPAGLVPERRVEMERGARRTHVVLRHEGDRRAHQVRDLLRTVLVESRAVGHLERLRVAEVDLLLAAPPLSLRRLDRNVGAFHPVPDRADQRLLFRRLQDVIVLEVARDGRQVVIALRARALEGLRETVELELGGSLDDEPLRRGALD